MVSFLQVQACDRGATRGNEDLKLSQLCIIELSYHVLVLQVSYASTEVTDTKTIQLRSKGQIVEDDRLVSKEEVFAILFDDDLQHKLKQDSNLGYLIYYKESALKAGFRGKSAKGSRDLIIICLEAAIVLVVVPNRILA